jgi:hypothetical protein
VKLPVVSLQWHLFAALWFCLGYFQASSVAAGLLCGTACYGLLYLSNVVYLLTQCLRELRQMDERLRMIVAQTKENPFQDGEVK